MHIIPYLQPTMQGIMSSHCSWLYSYHGSLQKLQTQCQNQQVLQWTRSIRLATSETLLLSPRVSTNEQSNMQGSKLYTSLKKQQLTIQLLNESVVSLHQNRAFGILSFPCRSSVHGEIPLVQAALSSILPHHRIDGLIRIHQGVMKPLLTWRIKTERNPSRSSRKGTVPVIPLRLRTWMKTWLTCLTQLESNWRILFILFQDIYSRRQSTKVR